MMTSGTGPSEFSAGPQSGGARRDGFTLLELLVVISIIVILMALLAVVGGSMRSKAKVAGTESLIERVKSSLQLYKSDVGKYPDDGIDTPVVSEGGTDLYSGAALSNALCQPVKLKHRKAGGKYQYTEKPAYIGDMKEGDLYRLDEDSTAFEMIDAWGNGLHYDNLGGQDSYSEQGDLGEDWHLHPVDKHDPDPREDPAVVFKTGPQNTNEYDVWSSGRYAHTPEYNPLQTIANFRTKSDTTGEESEEN